MASCASAARPTWVVRHVDSSTLAPALGPLNTINCAGIPVDSQSSDAASGERLGFRLQNPTFLFPGLLVPDNDPPPLPESQASGCNQGYSGILTQLHLVPS